MVYTCEHGIRKDGIGEYKHLPILERVASVAMLIAG